jgi:alkanesulfonate monooxygenase SsuD/methylene tetrahydromethanopterin reductase-like flavin-dependent oxidoreductase (luciferase family)
MHNANRLKIGMFGSNCSSGRVVTKAPHRWSGNWADNLALARMADDAGIDFMLPLGRWKGYGGDTDYQGETLETLTWASGLLASTRRITVFGTVHAPLFNPVIAAKAMVTADHIGQGRFGLNIVVGWNEDEFEMFGVKQREHELRYEYAQEWIDVLKRIWSETDDFDFAGKYLDMKGIRVNPKPYGGTRPLIMNAGASPTGQAYAIRNCDAFFIHASRTSIDDTAKSVASVREKAAAEGGNVGFYTTGTVACRQTQKEAEDYYHASVVEHCDWSAMDLLLAKRKLSPEILAIQDYAARRRALALNMGGLAIVGDPDHVAGQLAAYSAAGLNGIAITLINFTDELPFLCQEVLPRLERMGLRQKVN